MSFFSGKLAFITGGSSGIGLETGVLLASQGCRLVLLARGQARLDKACRYIEEQSGQNGRQIHAVSTVSMDVQFLIVQPRQDAWRIPLIPSRMMPAQDLPPARYPA